MIKSLNSTKIRRELDETKLPEYWAHYFKFRMDLELHTLIENELIARIELIKNSPNKFIDSQQLIGDLLTDLGRSHNFHRQFNEHFAELMPSQVLGMQLYRVILDDDIVWTYSETQHSGHRYPHATYWVP